MARKREEKADKDNSKAQKERSTEGQCQETTFASLKQQLAAMKLVLREILGDGNCLFGALADQLDGTSKTHMKHRQEVVKYMEQNREDFEPFVEDDQSFERHLSNLSSLGTYGGNECIVAFARNNSVKVVIHQLNTPLWQIDGTNDSESVRELHISYHNGDHYNSVRRIGDCSSIPSNIKLSVIQSRPGDFNCKKMSPTPPAYYDNVPEEETYSAPYDSQSDSLLRQPTLVGYGMSAAGPGLSENDCDYIVPHNGHSDIEKVQRFLEANKHDIRETMSTLPSYYLNERKGKQANDFTSIWDKPSSEEVDSGLSDDLSHLTPRELTLKKLQVVAYHAAKKKELKKLRRQERRRQHPRHETADEVDGGGQWELGEDAGDIIVVKDIACLSI